MKLDVLSRICGFNITFKRGLLNVSMPLLKCFRGVIQLLRIAEGEGQRALCICVDKQHPLVLPASPMPRLAVVVVLPTPPLLIRHRDHFAIRHMGFLLHINLAAWDEADGYVEKQNDRLLLHRRSFYGRTQENTRFTFLIERFSIPELFC